MMLDFWRALGITTGIFFVNWTAGSLIDPTALFLTVKTNVSMILAEVVILAFFTYAYFHTPALKPSAWHGFQLAVFLSLMFGGVYILGEIISPMEYHPIPYESLITLAQIATGLGVPALTGWYLNKYKK